jgi:predicted enzyme related to lactoylglutathione lyase
MSKHPVVHIEISAKNLVDASHFYSKLFGWKTEQIPAMNYATFTAEGGPGGGFNPVSEDAPAGTVLVYINSDDIEADLSRVAKLGGKILVPKTEIPGEGWFGVFTDPTGNKLALFTTSHSQQM